MGRRKEQRLSKWRKTTQGSRYGQLIAISATVTTTAAATAAVATSTTTAATATVPTTTAATTTTTATWTRRPLAGFVDRQRTTVDLLSVECGDSRLQAFVRLHLHETKTTGTSGLTIGDHLGTPHGAVRRKHCFEIS